MAGLPYLTADLKGVPGVLKAAPADFVVEEIPAYQPAGEGEHLFLWIEKEDVSADDLVRHLAKSLGIRRDDIGVAGLKDRRAVTRQFVSVPISAKDRIDAARSDAIRILSAVPHRNKLKTGHLRGNRFSILLRRPEPPTGSDAPGDEANRLKDATEIVRRLRELGLPNYYGDQRFGIGGETAELGFALLRGEKTAAEIPPAKRKFLLRLALSAAQSELFNRALADRMERGEQRRVFVGDVMQKVDTGGLFTAEDADVEQRRLDLGEIHVTGPIFGPKMPTPRGEPAIRETALLVGSGLTEDAFHRYPKLTSGTRRPYLASVADLTVSQESEGLRFEFSLPSGAYATVVLREIMKTA